MMPCTDRSTRLPRVTSAMVAGLMAVLPGAGAIAATDHAFSVEGAAGLEYDDNITVVEIDRVSDESDFAVTAELSGEWEMAFDDRNTLSLGYGFSQREQLEYSEFDLQIHGTNVTYEHEIDGITLGLTHQYFHTRLGGDAFLDLQRLTPFASGFVAERLFLRGSLTYKTKDLRDRRDRDAKTPSAQVLGYYFVDGTDTYLKGKYRYEDENAEAAAFDFTAHVVEVGVRTRLPVGGADNRLSVDLEHEVRDYDGVTAAIGERRSDDRTTLDLSWTLPLSAPFYVEGGYRYRTVSSNVSSAEFDENQVSVAIGFDY